MPATSNLDRRILRALSGRSLHGYALVRDLAAEGGPDRATVYRRLSGLARRGLVSATKRKGKGPPRRSHRLTALGDEELRRELREAVRLLLEAFDARLREPRGKDGASPRSLPRGPVVFASGSRISGVETSILAAFARAAPRRVHLVLPPGVPPPQRVPSGVAVAEAPWGALPFRDGFARLLLVNELPPARGLARAVAEWRRVLAGTGTLHVIAPAPLPRGVDPFVDFFADLQDELFPDQARAPGTAAVTAALRREFRRVEERREGNQRVWTAK